MILKKEKELHFSFCMENSFCYCGVSKYPTLVLYDTILLFHTLNYKIFLKSIGGYLYYV